MPEIRHKDSSAVYALKVIKTTALSRPESYSRFLEEVRLWSTAAACEGVTQVLAVFRINEIPCVCAEWMDGGGTLRHLLTSKDANVFYATMDRVIGTLEWVYGNHRIIVSFR